MSALRDQAEAVLAQEASERAKYTADLDGLLDDLTWRRLAERGLTIICNWIGRRPKFSADVRRAA